MSKLGKNIHVKKRTYRLVYVHIYEWFNRKLDYAPGLLDAASGGFFCHIICYPVAIMADLDACVAQGTVRGE